MVGYIVREKNGSLYLFFSKPQRNHDEDCWFSLDGHGVVFLDWLQEFRDVKYDDEFPTPVEVEVKKAIKKSI